MYQFPSAAENNTITAALSKTANKTSFTVIMPNGQSFNFPYKENFYANIRLQ